MTNQISTQTLSFYGSDLITLKVEDVIYTAVRPLVEAIGLDWASQSVKLNKNKVKFNCCDIATVGADGKIRQMLCMPLKKLNGWLFSINPEKVRADLREKVIQYQEECFEALYNYWHFGKAERKTTVDERTGLRNAVNMLVGKKALMYNEAYNLVHQRFNVESIEDLTAEQLPQAVEYIHKIYLEGELIIDEPKTNNGIQISADVFEAIMKHTRLAKRLAEQVEPFHRQLHQMLGLERWQKNDIASLAYGVRAEFNYWLDEGEKLIEKYRREKAEINYANARLRKATA